MTKSSPHSNVKTYQLDEAEHAKIKKQTPDFYVKKREEGYKDKDIAEFMGIPQSKLSTLKNGLGFVGLTFDEVKKQHEKMQRKSNKFKPKPASEFDNQEPANEDTSEEHDNSDQESNEHEHSFEALKNDLKQKIEAKDNEIERLQGEVDRLTNELKKTQTSLNGCQEAVRFMEHQQEAEEGAQSDQEEVIQGLREEIARLKGDIDEIESTKAFYRESADEMHDRNNTLSKQHEQAEDKAYHAIELIKLM